MWCWDGYAIYAAVILIISLGSIALELYETIKNNTKIRQMALYSCDVEVKLEGDMFQTRDSSDLVPGDIIKIPESIILPCDIVLLFGSCIVNEAMLTGESIPVMKASLPSVNSEIYDPDSCGKYTLFGGT